MAVQPPLSLHRRIQQLLLGFSRGITATLSVSAALEALAAEVNVLFGTKRVSIWIHNRRARELALGASSDREQLTGTRVQTESDTLPARGLRLDAPQFTAAAPGVPRVLVAPLRGWRRALGTVIVEGQPDALDGQQFLDAVHDFAVQLSFALENVQLLEEVLQQRRLLEDTFNSLIDLVVVTDDGLRVVQMNDAFAARVGASRHALMERPLADLIGVEMATWAAEPEPAARLAADAGAVARTTQFTDERLDGIFAATVTPLINRDLEPVGRVLVARDITSQMQLESEREALRERLAQAEKLASLGQFVAGIAHEMNNPLQGVLGHLELLISNSEAARPVRPTLRQIYQEGERAAKIVRNLLIFTGSQRLSRQRLRLDRVLARTLATRAATLRRNRIEVARHVAEDVPRVSGDTLLLQQALLNILINAEHAIASRGEPGRITTSVAAVNGGEVVRLTIEDSGPGIPPAVLPRIFDPFFTTKGVGEGTGLGLAITYGIVQEHGGTIQASNTDAGGARFTIDLPALPSVAAGGKSTEVRKKVRAV
jgi:C4-dicarboxylate-specific signal transduction histidine kinase